MASSKGETVPPFVTNYHLVDSHNSLISFSRLPLHWTDVVEHGDLTVAFLLGSTVDGLQPVNKEVTGWKLELSSAVPEVYVLSKDKTWIKLQNPLKSYESVVRSVLNVAHCLHVAKRNVQAARSTASFYDVIEPMEEKCLEAHLPLIRCAVANDKNLAKSEYLVTFLMKIENPGRIEALYEENQTTNKPKFVVSDDEGENEDDFYDEIFDSLCTFCDNGGDVLPCEGPCMRSFHPTVDAGFDTSCESLGLLNAAQFKVYMNLYGTASKHQKHQCFACGSLGSFDKSSSAEIFPCVSATCGHFYHPGCAAYLLYPNDETLSSQLTGQIAAGISFTCPIHKCKQCGQGEDKDVHESQFAVCRRCPTSYHRRCLPKMIAFKASDDGTILQRAWDDLLPKRILMYCVNHKIIPNIGTPKRYHVLFPSKVDAEMKAKILKLTEDVSSSFDREEYINEMRRRCTGEIYGAPQHGLVKTITMGEVESSVKAVEAALKKLEIGGSIEDAKAICEPSVLHQLARWKKELGVNLAPFM
ncbi:protein ENHANCED DOWNY MILDEW 2-like [Bidens hawaiensis]|uniref:protein ENHANCED DOWNY MILDEW 2-like n=1 Tax=Bidens hawaiensis TaxID=980011 RepID=UPI00404B82AE